MPDLPVFHIAFPVKDIVSTKKFYIDKLGFRLALEEPKRMMIDFYGHQAVAHVSEQDIPAEVHMYPRHFGVVFDELKQWEQCLARARKVKLDFFSEPFARFPDTPREHRTFFLKDPSLNLLEFKWYRSGDKIMNAERHCEEGPEGRPKQSL
jgi:uncharacterized protein